MSESENAGVDTAEVVRVFNLLGYEATFAAVAEKLGIEEREIYCQYQSREALGEVWLSQVTCTLEEAENMGAMFRSLMFALFEKLEGRRDFSRAWLKSIKTTGVLHLPTLQTLHGSLHDYFVGWLSAYEDSICLPDDLFMKDVQSELADALCVVVAGLVGVWEADRSKNYANAVKMTESISHWLDGLLTRREEFCNQGLLAHLVRMLGVPHAQFLRPLLDALLKPERAAAFADPVQLVEALRALRPPKAP